MATSPRTSMTEFRGFLFTDGAILKPFSICTTYFGFKLQLPLHKTINLFKYTKVKLLFLRNNVALIIK